MMSSDLRGENQGEVYDLFFLYFLEVRLQKAHYDFAVYESFLSVDFMLHPFHEISDP